MKFQKKLATASIPLLLTMTNVTNAATCASPCEVGGFIGAHINLNDVGLTGVDPDGQDWQMSNVYISTSNSEFKIGQGGKESFLIDDDAPDETLVVGGSTSVGPRVGIGTSNPSDNLQITSGKPTIILDDDTFPLASQRKFKISYDFQKFLLEEGFNGNDRFVIESSTSNTNSIYVNSDGKIGFGVVNPTDALQLFGRTSAISFGQGNNRWRIAPGTNHFTIEDRDGSLTKPFRIEADAADNSLVVDANANVGVGTSSPEAGVHVVRTSTASIPDMFELENAGDVRFKFEDTVANGFWRMSVENSANQFVITRSGTGSPELKLTNTGDLSIRGGLTANVGTTDDTFPDYVFEKDYPLMNLSKLDSFITKHKHLPNIPSKADVKAKDGQLNMTDMQLKLLEKVEELTLYTIQLHKKNIEQEKTIAKNSKLKQRLASLEKLVTNLASNQNTLPLNGETVAINEK